MDIREQFNRIAGEYDSGRRKFIPCFDSYYVESTAVAAALAGRPARILDLGAGTGLLTMYWLEKFPQAQFVLADIAEDMLKIARRRFDGLANVSYTVSDYSRDLPEGPFDTVISALSIHHLEHVQKEALFRNICRLLPEGGLFVNYDQFCLDNGVLNRAQETLWVDHIRASGLSAEDIARWQERRKLDRECSVDSELVMLRRSGFETAECFFHSGKFAVIAARKGINKNK